MCPSVKVELSQLKGYALAAADTESEDGDETPRRRHEAWNVAPCDVSALGSDREVNPTRKAMRQTYCDLASFRVGLVTRVCDSGATGR